jgi:hypothetical protein
MIEEYCLLMLAKADNDKVHDVQTFLRLASLPPVLYGLGMF